MFAFPGSAVTKCVWISEKYYLAAKAGEAYNQFRTSFHQKIQEDQKDKESIVQEAAERSEQLEKLKAQLNRLKESTNAHKSQMNASIEQMRFQQRQLLLIYSAQNSITIPECTVNELKKDAEQNEWPFKTSPISVEGRKLQQAKVYIEYARQQESQYPQQRDRLLKQADQALDAADSAYSSGDKIEGDAQVSLALIFMDVTLLLIPGVGWAMDVYALVTDESFVIGEKLSNLELAIAGAGIATADNVKLYALKKFTVIGHDLAFQVQKITSSARKFGATENGIKVYRRVHDAIDSLPSRIKIDRIREGADETKTAIIGRSMGDPSEGLVGVRDAASHFGSKNIKTEIFESSDGAWDSFRDVFARYRDEIGDSKAMLPDHLIKTTELFKENQVWVNKLKSGGLTSPLTDNDTAKANHNQLLA